MLQRLRRLIPTPEQIRGNRWLAWLGPSLHHPRLWRWSRRGVALGVATGVFFGLLVPIAQIPMAAAMTVLLRANLPAAVASTLVTNPVTFGPIYYGAYRLGAWVSGDRSGPPPEREKLPADLATDSPEDASNLSQRTAAVGRSLMLGLALLAAAGGVLGYALVHWFWGLVMLLRRRKARKP